MPFGAQFSGSRGSASGRVAAGPLVPSGGHATQVKSFGLLEERGFLQTLEGRASSLGMRSPLAGAFRHLRQFGQLLTKSLLVVEGFSSSGRYKERGTGCGWGSL